MVYKKMFDDEYLLDKQTVNIENIIQAVIHKISVRLLRK